MTKPADLLKKQIDVNNGSISEFTVANLTLNGEIAENNNCINMLNAANVELQIAISKLEENI